jgi:hypothetical protein
MIFNGYLLVHVQYIRQRSPISWFATLELSKVGEDASWKAQFERIRGCECGRWLDSAFHLLSRTL